MESFEKLYNKQKELLSILSKYSDNNAINQLQDILKDFNFISDANFSLIFNYETNNKIITQCGAAYIDDSLQNIISSGYNNIQTSKDNNLNSLAKDKLFNINDSDFLDIFFSKEITSYLATVGISNFYYFPITTNNVFETFIVFGSKHEISPEVEDVINYFTNFISGSIIKIIHKTHLFLQDNEWPGNTENFKPELICVIDLDGKIIDTVSSFKRVDLYVGNGKNVMD